MKKVALTVLVLVVSLLAIAGVAFAEHDSVGGIGVNNTTIKIAQ